MMGSSTTTTKGFASMAVNDVLQSLRPTARRLVTPEFVSGARACYHHEDCAPLLAPLERDIPLSDLDAIVDDALTRYGPGDPASDAALAVAIHRSLRITRREAADPGVFRYLAVIRYPELVRYRWEYRSFATMQSRFWRAGTRHDSNAFSRWWWIAELTRYGEDYSLTHQVLNRSTLATTLFSRELCQHRPAVAAAVAVLHDTPGPLIEASLKNLGKMLAVRVLESLDRSELDALISEALEIATVSS